MKIAELFPLTEYTSPENILTVPERSSWQASEYFLDFLIH